MENKTKDLNELIDLIENAGWEINCEDITVMYDTKYKISRRVELVLISKEYHEKLKEENRKDREEYKKKEECKAKENSDTQ